MNYYSVMSTGLVYDACFYDHDTGPGHPESPERVRAIVDRLRDKLIMEALTPIEFEKATIRQLEAVHDPQHVQRVFEVCAAGHSMIDGGDTPVCASSAHTAQAACGGMIAAVDAVMAGRVDNAFCASRPPGHHAEKSKAMGFCLFNTVAVAAQHLLDQHGLKRVAIIDFDVHHGNGTQDIFYDRRDVLFCSIHEHPTFLYPGTGFVHERGVGEGEGFTLNVPIQPKGGDDEYRHAFVYSLMPVLERFEPEFILLSSGFDASAEDPLAHMNVTPEGFGWMTRHLLAEANRLCDGRVVSQLEGGYHLRSLAESVRVHVEAMLRDWGGEDMMAMKMGF